MSQDSVYKVLKKTNKAMTIIEIAKKAKITPSTASSNLLKLYNQNLISRLIKKQPGLRTIYYYKVKN